MHPQEVLASPQYYLLLSVTSRGELLNTPRGSFTFSPESAASVGLELGGGGAVCTHPPRPLLETVPKLPNHKLCSRRKGTPMVRAALGKAGATHPLQDVQYSPSAP